MWRTLRPKPKQLRAAPVIMKSAEIDATTPKVPEACYVHIVPQIHD
jgi:hypothetical protein